MVQEQLFASFMLHENDGLEIALYAENVVEATVVQNGIKPLPGSKDFLEGIMNLRDEIVPVINLKKRLGLSSCSYDANAKVAIVNFYDQQFGLMVDDIKEVFRAESDELIPVSPVLQSEDRLISSLIHLRSSNRTAELLDLRCLFPGNLEDLENEAGGRYGQAASRKNTTWSRFVVFRCSGQEYGVPVKYVQEITFLADIDEMFKSGLLEGALDLRGRTVPVMNAIHLLGGARNSMATSENHRILVLATEECVFGMIVEQVKEILTLPDDEILKLPSGQDENLTGIYARDQGGEVMLLDMPNLVCNQIEDLKSMSRLKNGKDQEDDSVRRITSANHHLITENCYLIFSVDKHFAIELKDVQEIIESDDLLTVPGSSDYRSGVINLRGQVVPVIHLSNFFGFEQQGSNRGSKLIICRGHEQTVALEVNQIVTIFKQETFHNTPSLNPQLAGRKDVLDRLIEFDGDQGMIEHVLVINTYTLVRNYLASADDTVSEPEQQEAVEQLMPTLTSE